MCMHMLCHIAYVLKLCVACVQCLLLQFCEQHIAVWCMHSCSYTYIRRSRAKVHICAHACVCVCVVGFQLNEKCEESIEIRNVASGS